jgi:hypothetical protein
MKISLKKMPELKKMSEFKQSLKKKLEPSKRKPEGSQSVWGISLGLVHRLLPEKKQQQTVKAQAASSPQMMEFLEDVMLEEYLAKTFTKTYGEERAFADGVAHQAKHVYNILKGLEDG